MRPNPIPTSSLSLSLSPHKMWQTSVFRAARTRLINLFIGFFFTTPLLLPLYFVSPVVRVQRVHSSKVDNCTVCVRVHLHFLIFHSIIIRLHAFYQWVRVFQCLSSVPFTTYNSEGMCECVVRARLNVSFVCMSSALFFSSSFTHFFSLSSIFLQVFVK